MTSEAREPLFQQHNHHTRGDHLKPPGRCPACDAVRAGTKPLLSDTIIEKVLRWAAWSWGDPRVPEPPCPTDAEFYAVATRFGYVVDRGAADDQ